MNTAVGAGTLVLNTADNNTALGAIALLLNTTGNSNTATGASALTNNVDGSSNTAVGFNALNTNTHGTGNTAIGRGALFNTVTGANNTALGDQASRRFKHDIKSMDKASEAILALKPVTFHYKSDVKNTPCFGLIAEEVAEINPNLVVRDKNNEVLTVRYDAVNAMLLNEFLKEHRTVQEQGATIARQQKQIEALTTGLQKVSAQLELNKPGPQTVVNTQ